MKRDTITILGIPIDRVTCEQAGQRTKQLIEESHKSCKMVFAPNTEFIMTAQKDKEFFDILQESELSTPDSVGVMWGAKLQKKFFPERIPGQAYFRKIVELSNQEGITIYLLGGEPGIAEKARDNLVEKFPHVKIVGVHHGFFDEQEEQDVINEINQLQPNVLFVALGAPRQEKWIYQNRARLKVDVAAGQGGTYDYEAGKVKRAPSIVQKLGIEWLWRLLMQPKRIIRMRVLPIYLIKLILKKDKTKGKFNIE